MLESELMARLAVGNPELLPPDHTVAYGVGRSRYGELRLPGGGGPHPVVVLLHGGFWRHEWSLVHMNYLAAALVRHGFATWNLEYRRLGEDGAGWPGTFEDVLTGVRHLGALAPAHHLDPSRLVLLGGSAGGQLALWLAAQHDRLPHPLRVRGVIALAPVCDLERAALLDLGGGAAQALLGGNRELYGQTSPRALLPLGRPQVLIHGSADRHVPLVESELYSAAARAVGDAVELVTLPDVDHFPLINGTEPAFPFVLGAVRRFLDERAFECERVSSSVASQAEQEAGLQSFFAQQRAQFPGLARGAASELVHLNNAAGSELPEVAIEAMAAYMRGNFCNEGYTFRRLEVSHALVRSAREASAELLACTPEEVGFGASTTSNLFFIARALGRTLLAPGDRVLVSEACHEANIAPWLTLADYGACVELIPMRDDTHLDYDWLEANIDARTRLVSVGASSNATGTIHDLGRVVRAARSVSALVSVDAAHYVPHCPVDFAALGADLLFFSVYKCFGPHLAGFCVRKALCERWPEFGNPRPKEEEGTAARFETGTRSFESLAGWLATIGYLEELGRRCPRPDGEPAPRGRREALRSALQSIERWERVLTRHGDARLRAIPGLELHAQPGEDPRPRLGVFSCSVRRPLNEVARALEDAGVEAVTGHNGAVRTMARLAPGGACLRLSIAHYNTRADIDRAVDCLAQVAARRA